MMSAFCLECANLLTFSSVKIMFSGKTNARFDALKNENVVEHDLFCIFLQLQSVFRG